MESWTFFFLNSLGSWHAVSLCRYYSVFTCSRTPSFRLRKMLYHIPLQVYLLSMGRNLLQRIIILLSLLSHFILEFFQIFLHQIAFVIKKCFMLIHFLFQFVELQRANPVGHHVNLLLDHVLKVLMFILSKHLQARYRLRQLTLSHG